MKGYLEIFERKFCRKKGNFGRKEIFFVSGNTGWSMTVLICFGWGLSVNINVYIMHILFYKNCLNFAPKLSGISFKSSRQISWRSESKWRLFSKSIAPNSNSSNNNSNCSNNNSNNSSNNIAAKVGRYSCARLHVWDLHFYGASGAWPLPPPFPAFWEHFYENNITKFVVKKGLWLQDT